MTLKLLLRFCKSLKYERIATLCHESAMGPNAGDQEAEETNENPLFVKEPHEMNSSMAGQQ